MLKEKIRKKITRKNIFVIGIVAAILFSAGMLMMLYDHQIEKRTITLERFTYYFWEYESESELTHLNFSFELIQGDEIFFFYFDEITYWLWKRYGDFYGEEIITISGTQDVLVELNEKQTYYFGFYPIGINPHTYFHMEVDLLKIGMFLVLPVTINIMGLLFMFDIKSEIRYYRDNKKIVKEALHKKEMSRMILKMNKEFVKVFLFIKTKN
ncbi:MAG: hypothetical protein KAS63_01755 [Candidatus Heimdallarchaeota archaeon]|nr:hypothetical protein [Candidatus Heimdallarchaeota archaeon]MCK4954059.1 hypothetical protein [Candidatus Heimdallarchaeota archaeon]